MRLATRIFLSLFVIQSLACVFFYRRWQTAAAKNVVLTDNLSASRQESLSWAEKAAHTNTITETVTVTRPGETITKTVEKVERVEVEKARSTTKSENATAAITKAAPTSDHTFSISIYKPADLNVKNWSADFGVKIDAIGAEVVIGASGDVTQRIEHYYGGFRWQM